MPSPCIVFRMIYGYCVLCLIGASLLLSYLLYQGSIEFDPEKAITCSEYCTREDLPLYKRLWYDMRDWLSCTKKKISQRNAEAKNASVFQISSVASVPRRLSKMEEIVRYSRHSRDIRNKLEALNDKNAKKSSKYRTGNVVRKSQDMSDISRELLQVSNTKDAKYGTETMNESSINTEVLVTGGQTNKNNTCLCPGTGNITSLATDNTQRTSNKSQHPKNLSQKSIPSRRKSALSRDSAASGQKSMSSRNNVGGRNSNVAGRNNNVTARNSKAPSNTKFPQNRRISLSAASKRTLANTKTPCDTCYDTTMSNELKPDPQDKTRVITKDLQKIPGKNVSKGEIGQKMDANATQEPDKMICLKCAENLTCKCPASKNVECHCGVCCDRAYKLEEIKSKSQDKTILIAEELKKIPEVKEPPEALVDKNKVLTTKESKKIKSAKGSKVKCECEPVKETIVEPLQGLTEESKDVDKEPTKDAKEGSSEQPSRILKNPDSDVELVSRDSKYESPFYDTKKSSFYRDNYKCKPPPCDMCKQHKKTFRSFVFKPWPFG